MSIVVRNEMIKWAKKLNTSDLDKYQITLINIILTNLDELEPLGTAAGRRAKFLNKKIQEKNLEFDNELLNFETSNASNSNVIERINLLSVKSFRGFETKQIFDFSTQYTFIYGPNGSGKSSLCEALEYKLLDSIREADARKIQINKYIKNNITGQCVYPELICKFSEGNEGDAISNYDLYKFSFIEKNRIDEFSRIKAASNGSQANSIASLFGITAFNNFIKSFTSNIESYMITTSELKETFAKEKITYDYKKKLLPKLVISINELKFALTSEIKKLQNDKLTNSDEAKKFLNDNRTGIITKLIEEHKRREVKEITIPDFIIFKDAIKDLSECFEDISSAKNDLANLSMEGNYLALYKAIVQVENKAYCPACHTPLEDVKVNPYINASKQIEKLKNITELQEFIKEKSAEAYVSYNKITKYLSNNDKIYEMFSIPKELFIQQFSKQDFQDVSELILKFQKQLITINQGLETVDFKNTLLENNNKALKCKEEYETKIAYYKKIYEELIRMDTKLTSENLNLKECEKEIEEFEEKNKAKQEEIEKEELFIEYNKKMIIAYGKIIESLQAYNNTLPAELSMNLSAKVMEYYNIINTGDALFEQVKTLSLPKNSDESILVSFKDVDETGPLQILSEGHIKILGLAILLAKASYENLNFLIFDDIVNAIDDDHRLGVASLLMEHSDFRTKQIILTCHGCNFVVDLQSKLPTNKRSTAVKSYTFIAAENLAERGVSFKNSDIKIPMDLAEEYYKQNNLKESASKCRVVTEVLANKLWKKIANEKSMSIAVGLRGPNSKPDLKSVIDGLKKATNRIEGAEELNSKISNLSEDNNWRILNKGIHYEDDQPEFSGVEIKRIIDLLKEIDALISSSKFKVSVI